MDISLIVIIGLPVLILTGSLHNVIANAGLDKKSVVLFFACTAALSLLPAIRITQSVWISAQGAFFCIAPAVYLAAKKAYTCRFFIVFSMVTLIAVLLSFLEGSFTMSYMPITTGVIIALAALLGGGASAAVFAPVLAGVYFAVQSVVYSTTGMAQRMVLLSGVGTASICTAVCLLIAYIIYRPRGRHAKQQRFGRPHTISQTNKGLGSTD